MDIENINKSILGFLTQKTSSNNSIVFKIKGLKKGKIERGLECITKGTYKEQRINNINKVIFKDVNYFSDKKYYISKDKSITIKKLISGSKIKKEKIDIKLNDMELCIELELTLRYLDKIKHNNNKFFFSTIEDIFNGRVRNFKL